MNSSDSQPATPDSPPSNPFLDRERERMHRQMLSSVSHDLKTPLASIIGSLEVYERMKRKLSEDQQNTLIQVALQEAYRLDNFITNILDMAKLESGAVKAKHERIDVGGLVKNCAMMLGNLFQGYVSIIKAESGDMYVTSDPVLLNRAIYLVLDNAVKYAGTPPNVRIAYGKENGVAFVRIHDNGPGVPDAQKEIIFSKYTRFAKQDQQNAGTGLGLAICREIMTLLGGTIAVVNCPEGGAEFTLRFPEV